MGYMETLRDKPKRRQIEPAIPELDDPPSAQLHPWSAHQLGRKWLLACAAFGLFSVSIVTLLTAYLCDCAFETAASIDDTIAAGIGIGGVTEMPINGAISTLAPDSNNSSSKPTSNSTWDPLSLENTTANMSSAAVDPSPTNNLTTTNISTTLSTTSMSTNLTVNVSTILAGNSLGSSLVENDAGSTTDSSLNPSAANDTVVNNSSMVLLLPANTTSANLSNNNTTTTTIIWSVTENVTNNINTSSSAIDASNKTNAANVTHPTVVIEDSFNSSLEIIVPDSNVTLHTAD